MFKDMLYLTEDRVTLTYEIPYAEIINDFFDEMKSLSRGYSSMEYAFIGYRENDLVKLELRINGEPANPLSLICAKENATKIGRAMCVRLKELIPRQMFRVPIQACIGGKPIASVSKKLQSEIRSQLL